MAAMTDAAERARAAWAAARVLVWPESYVLASLPPARLAEAAALVGSRRSGFAALVVERDEVSITVDRASWDERRPAEARESGPYRAITIDVDVELDVCGFLAPAAARLAEAGVAIVPQCAFRKDHFLVHAGDLPAAVRVLEAWIAASIRR
jgi:hypothetical protein